MQKAENKLKLSSFYLTWEFPWLYFVLTGHTELGIITSKHLPSIIPCVSRNIYRAKNHYLELRIHLTGNLEFSESSKLSLWPFLN